MCVPTDNLAHVPDWLDVVEFALQDIYNGVYSKYVNGHSLLYITFHPHAYMYAELTTVCVSSKVCIVTVYNTYAWNWSYIIPPY